MAEKMDFKKQWKHLYAPSSKAFSIVEVPPMQYLAIDGAGDPNTAPAYKQAVEALYAVAYKLKFLSKTQLGKDYVVPPLEGLWWAEDMEKFTTSLDKNCWEWTMMIMSPDWITAGMVAQGQENAAKAKDLPALRAMRIFELHEGTSVQIMHRGPYDDEGPVLKRLHEVFMPEHGLTFAGKHHEIYMSDPRRTASEKLRTVLRQPVQPVEQDEG